jgi:neutral ceramidase
MKNVVATAACLLGLAASPAAAELQVGSGIADATASITDVVFMGMANSAQKGQGLHFRLRSRAYVMHDTDTDKRFAFVSIDAGMGGQVVKNRVIKKLNDALELTMYSDDNVCISGTHTHSGPSGFLQETLYQFAGSGWVPETVDGFVDAVVDSIASAHARLTPADAFLNTGQVANASINRSPSAYLFNPAAERAKYLDQGGDTDHAMVLAKFVAKDKSNGTQNIGMVNWFAVHPTSMNNTNLLVSGDNKGYASYVMERGQNGPTSKVRPGKGPFVAAFASTNLGDVTPNIKGPHCEDTGLPCDYNTSTCNGKNEKCVAHGPGKDMFESTRIIAQRQVDVASSLFDTAETPIVSTGKGPLVDFRHTYVTMPGLKIENPKYNANATLCSAAMGDSFAAGTIDGPGMFDFTQVATPTEPTAHLLLPVDTR